LQVSLLLKRHPRKFSLAHAAHRQQAVVAEAVVVNLPDERALPVREPNVHTLTRENVIVTTLKRGATPWAHLFHGT